LKSKDSLLKEENELLEKFKLRLSTNSQHLQFWKDGIVDYDFYWNSHPRLLYILKDANDNKSNDLRGFLRNGEREQTWGVVARWNYAVFNKYPSWDEITNREACSMRKDWLKYSAMMNLKKTPSSDNSDLFEVSTLCNDLLLKQIELYEPEFIICCGTSWVIGEIFAGHLSKGWKFSRNGVRFSRWSTIGSYVIEIMHPQAQYPNNFKHFMLTDAIKDLQNQK